MGQTAGRPGQSWEGGRGAGRGADCVRYECSGGGDPEDTHVADSACLREDRFPPAARFLLFRPSGAPIAAAPSEAETATAAADCRTARAGARPPGGPGAPAPGSGRGALPGLGDGAALDRERRRWGGGRRAPLAATGAAAARGAGECVRARGRRGRPPARPAGPAAAPRSRAALIWPRSCSAPGPRPAPALVRLGTPGLPGAAGLAFLRASSAVPQLLLPELVVGGFVVK